IGGAGAPSPPRSERASSPRDTPVSGSSPALALPSMPIPADYPLPPPRSKRNLVISGLATAGFAGGIALMVHTAAPTASDSKGSPSFPVSAAPVVAVERAIEPAAMPAATPSPSTVERAPAASASASSGARAKSPPKPRPTKDDPGDRIYRRE